MSKEEKPEKRKRSIKKENPEQKRIKQESGSKVRMYARISSTRVNNEYL